MLDESLRVAASSLEYAIDRERFETLGISGILKFHRIVLYYNINVKSVMR